MYIYYYTDDTEIPGKYKSFRAFRPYEKYCINSETSERTENYDFDINKYNDLMLKKTRLRTARNATLNHSDLFLLQDHVSDSGITYTEEEKALILTFRQELRDWPKTIVDNSFDALHAPIVPTCVPTKDQARINDFIALASL